MTLGIGDGSTTCSAGPGVRSNRNYLYVLYTQFGGPTPEEQADHSLGGYMNGELYLTASENGGDYWSVPVNLTNTKTPGCNPDSPYLELCASEHWATIAKTVDDINIFYVLDYDAGAAVYGEGSRTYNRVMYLRLPGGGLDSPYLCPDSLITCWCPCHGDPECDGAIDVLDVVRAVEETFREAPPPLDPQCRHVSRNDVNCDCIVNVFDLVLIVDRAFRNSTGAFCDPCAQQCEL
jgi:hypothetical protein